MKNNITYIVLLGIILVLLYILIFRQPTTIVEPFDDTELREQIRLKDSTASYWEENALYWLGVSADHEQRADSLENIKTNIKNEYSPTYKAIPGATATQRDSILRANW